MSCPHTDTTVAWMYGEAPEEHFLHVSGCAECQAITEAHERVAHALSGVAPALRTAPVAPKRRWWVVGTVTAAAAAALFAWAIPGARTVEDTDAQRTAAIAPFADEDVDMALDDLEADLDAFTAEFDAL